MAVDDRLVRAVLLERLKLVGYSPREIQPGDLLTIAPTFGPHQEALIVLDAGPDKEAMHAIARHLNSDWSEMGFVLLMVILPEPSTDEDIFKLWSLDMGWKFQAPQQLWANIISVNDGLETIVTRVLSALDFHTRGMH